MAGEDRPGRRRERPVARVEEVLCTGCAICEVVCPPDAIEIVVGGSSFTGVATVDADICTGCNLCAIDCPWEAIQMLESDGTFSDFRHQLQKARGYV